MLTETRLRFIKPASPQLLREPPSGPGWIHEIKQDGYRTEVLIESGTARAFSSSGLDWSDRYRPILAAALKTGAKTALLDGEVIVPDERGVSDFAAMQAAGRNSERLVYVAFDLLHLNGEAIKAKPIEERRAKLRKLVAKANDSRLVFSEAFEAEGPAVFAQAERMGLEGIVSKRLGSAYHSGSPSGWFKTKVTDTGKFVVIGIDRVDGVPMALLARETERGLSYAGQAFISLSGKRRDAFWQAVEDHKAEQLPVAGLRKKALVWLRPGMTATVRHLRGEGLLRHASVREYRLG